MGVLYLELELGVRDRSLGWWDAFLLVGSVGREESRKTRRGYFCLELPRPTPALSAPATLSYPQMFAFCCGQNEALIFPGMLLAYST